MNDLNTTKTQMAELVRHNEVSFRTEVEYCDFCERRASFDGKTKQGQWANMCEKHFTQKGIGLGTGKGQRLVY